MVPSSPKVPWRTGKMTSRDWARELLCWARSALSAESAMDLVDGFGFVQDWRGFCVAGEEVLGFGGGEPLALFGDADGDDVVFVAGRWR